jgi:hypothetical protein
LARRTAHLQFLTWSTAPDSCATSLPDGISLQTLWITFKCTLRLIQHMTNSTDRWWSQHLLEIRNGQQSQLTQLSILKNCFLRMENMRS